MKIEITKNYNSPLEISLSADLKGSDIVYMLAQALGNCIYYMTKDEEERNNTKEAAIKIIDDTLRGTK